MSKKKILLLLGGPSKERKVSLSTGRAVYLALRKLGYEVIKIDPKIGSKNFLQYNCDLAFNALHGQFGEDGTISLY
jgi:D-alanine-D-alanine ligase